VVWHSLITAPKDSAVVGIGKTKQILLVSQACRSPGACPPYRDCFGSWIQLAKVSRQHGKVEKVKLKGNYIVVEQRWP